MLTIEKVPLFKEVTTDESAVVSGGNKISFNYEINLETGEVTVEMTDIIENNVPEPPRRSRLSRSLFTLFKD